MILSLSAILPLTLSDYPPKAAAIRAVSNYLDEIEQLEKTVGQEASVTEAYDIFGFAAKKHAMLALCRIASRVRGAPGCWMILT